MRFSTTPLKLVLAFCFWMPWQASADIAIYSSNELTNRDALHADPKLIASLEALNYTQKPAPFLDQYDEQVWYADMNDRLSRYIPDDQRRKTFLIAVRKAAETAHLYPELVLSVIQIESGFDRFAVSKSGAEGYMQVMPFWLAKTGKPTSNLFETETNLAYGCTILRYYIELAHGDWTKGLAMYNGSIGKADYPYSVMTRLRKYWKIN